MYVRMQLTTLNAIRIYEDTDTFCEVYVATKAIGAQASRRPAVRRPRVRLVAANAVSNVEPCRSPAGALVQGLYTEETREAALLELSKKRESLEGLAEVLWHSGSAMEVLKEEIQGIYPQLSHPPAITPATSNRVCNCLALLQCLASDPQTRPSFLRAQFHLLVYPFLHAIGKEKPMEYLRLTSLGVIGALVKDSDRQSVCLLLESDIVRLCLKIMEGDSTDIAKTVSTFILQKLLRDDHGLNCICSSEDCLCTVTDVLSKMAHALQQKPCEPMLKHIVGCYLALTQHAKGRLRVRQSLPSSLKQLPGYIHSVDMERDLNKLLTKIKFSVVETVQTVDDLV